MQSHLWGFYPRKIDTGLFNFFLLVGAVVVVTPSFGEERPPSSLASHVGNPALGSGYRHMLALARICIARNGTRIVEQNNAG